MVREINTILIPKYHVEKRAVTLRDLKSLYNLAIRLEKLGIEDGLGLAINLVIINQIDFYQIPRISKLQFKQ
jgi:hypothetical protein